MLFLSQRRSALLAIQSYLKVALSTHVIPPEQLSSLNTPKFRGLVRNVLVQLREDTMKVDITPSEGLKQLALPRIAITAAPDAIGIQDEFLRFLARALRHTAFPWLDEGKMKKLETLIKYVLPVFKSYRLRARLLANDVPWVFRKALHDILDKHVKTRNARDSWSWVDGFNKQPQLKEALLDEVHAPLTLHDGETIGNQNTRLNEYVDLRQRNKTKMERIAKTVLSDDLGLGPNAKAIPAVREKLEALLAVSTRINWTQACANLC